MEPAFPTASHEVRGQNPASQLGPGARLRRHRLNVPVVRRAALFVSDRRHPDRRLSSAWHALVVPVTLLMLAGMAQACVNMIRPHWTQFRSTVRLITAGGALVILYFLLNAGDLVVLRGTNALGHGDVVQIVNRVLFYILVATAIAYAVDALWQIRRLIVQSSKFRGLGGFKTCV